MALESFASAFGFASAAGMAILGVLSLAGGRSRPPGAIAFGLFALLWSVQIALAHFGVLTLDVATFQLLFLVVIATLIALPYFLVEFVVAWAPAGSGWASVWRWCTIGVAVFASAVFVLSPQALLADVVPSPSGAQLYPVWGGLHVVLVAAPFFLTFALALPALAHAAARAPTPRIASRISILLAGLGIYTGFAAGLNLVFYASEFLAAPSPEPLLFTLVFLALALSAVIVAARELRAARKASDRADARRHRWVAAAILVPLLIGPVESLIAPSRFDSTGLWRLAAIGVLAYGIARWRMHDLPTRATRAAANATGATAAAATGAAAYGVGVAISTPAVGVFAGLLVLGAAIVPALSFAQRLFGIDRARARRDPDAALYGQRIDAYRAALEASLARDTFEEDREFLAALRERFTITDDEDRLLTHLARSSVLVARDENAWEAYERLRLLGEGGGGRTWLARDRARDRLVVLKEPLERWQLEPTAREAVLREARLAAKVRHPNVVAVEDVVEGKGSPVIVMEYLEGGSLAQLLRARGTLPWPQARTLALDILQGLEAIHAAGIVHRDVKPSNVLLSGDNVAKVADFGIAVAPGSSGARTMIVDPSHSTIAGTLHYMAPEARAGATPDRRADVYGCAAVLHEMVYGAPPGLASPLVVRSDVPAGLAALLARGLAQEPSARYPSARAFAEELTKLA